MCTPCVPLLACGLVAGCASQGQRPTVQSTGEAVQSGVSQTAGGVQTAVTQTASGVGGAVSAPLHDFNIVKENVPAVLLRARDNPYATAGVNECADILKEMGELDLALGPDLDTPRDVAHKTVYTNGASMAAEVALDAVKDTAEGVIPMKSWVRKLSGAEKNDKRVRQAVLAGEIRRAFLKGLGVMHDCRWPAAPLSFEPKGAAPPLAAPVPPPPPPPAVQPKTP
jgi:hypothetical protein